MGKGGRPKGRKDDYPRVRGIDKVHKDPEAYKAIKKYVQFEKDYNKLKKLKNTYGRGTRTRIFLIRHMKNIRYKQAELYEIISENYLVDNLTKKLGIGKTMPYRRYLHAKKKGIRENKKVQNGTENNN